MKALLAERKGELAMYVEILEVMFFRTTQGPDGNPICEAVQKFRGCLSCNDDEVYTMAGSDKTSNLRCPVRGPASSQYKFRGLSKS